MPSANAAASVLTFLLQPIGMPGVDQIMKEQGHRMLTVITALWVVGMLFARVLILAAQIGCSFPAAVRYFLPEITVAAIFLLFLPAVWRRKRWVPSALVALAVLQLVLLVATGFSQLWFVSVLLLLFLAYAVRSVVSESVPAAHSAIVPFLVLSKTPMYLGTPGAYLQLSAGALGAVGGFRQGHWSLATALLICSLLGLYGLWTMWSISTRTSTHDKYVVQSESGRVKDAWGLLAAWIALIGMAAMSTAIYRVEEVIILGVLLTPPLLMTTLAASMNPPDKVDGRRDMPLSGLIRRMSGRHYVGIACGVFVGVVGITFLEPTTSSGSGFCGLAAMFPISGDQWPMERPTVYGLHAGCNTGLLGQTLLLVVASFIFWMSGLLAVVIGKSTDAWLGAVTAAVTALAALTWRITAQVIALLALPLKPLPPISFYINWVSTIGIGIAVVFWAARLGYLGGRRAARYVEPQTASAERTEPEAG